MMRDTYCLICKRPDVTPTAPDASRAIFQVDCPTCGIYQGHLMGTAAYLRAMRDERRYILSAVVREASPPGGPARVLLTPEDIDRFSGDARLPATTGERLERIGRLLDKRQVSVGLMVSVVPMDDYPVAFARGPAEFTNMIRLLAEMGRVEQPHLGRPTDPHGVRLTAAGVTWLDEIRLARPTEGNLVFVAMSFDDAYRAEYEPAVRAACESFGYRAEPLYKDESNEMWMDRIFSRIRESRFVVADLSEHRGGVYLEAGYALGRNSQVIFTCKEDRFGLSERVHAVGASCDGAPERSVAHSDAKNWTVIRWASAGDLQAKLESRIGRVFGRFSPPA